MDTTEFNSVTITGIPIKNKTYVMDTTEFNSKTEIPHKTQTPCISRFEV